MKRVVVIIFSLLASHRAALADGPVIVAAPDQGISLGLELITRSWQAPTDSFEPYLINKLKPEVDQIGKAWRIQEEKRAWWAAAENNIAGIQAYSSATIGKSDWLWAKVTDSVLTIAGFHATRLAQEKQEQLSDARDRNLSESALSLARTLARNQADDFDKLAGLSGKEREQAIKGLIASDPSFWNAIDSADLPIDARDALSQAYARVLSDRINFLFEMSAADRQAELGQVAASEGRIKEIYANVVIQQGKITKVQAALAKEVRDVGQQVQDVALRAEVALAMSQRNHQDIAVTQSILWGSLSAEQRQAALQVGWFSWLAADKRKALQESIDRDVSVESITRQGKTTSEVLALTGEVVELLGGDPKQFRDASQVVGTLTSAFAAFASQNYIAGSLAIVSLLNSGRQSAGADDALAKQILDVSKQTLNEVRQLRTQVARQHAELMAELSQTQSLVQHVVDLLADTQIDASLVACKGLLVRTGGASEYGAVKLNMKSFADFKSTLIALRADIDGCRGLVNSSYRMRDEGVPFLFRTDYRGAKDFGERIYSPMLDVSRRILGWDPKRFPKCTRAVYSLLANPDNNLHSYTSPRRCTEAIESKLGELRVKWWDGRDADIDVALKHHLSAATLLTVGRAVEILLPMREATANFTNYPQLTDASLALGAVPPSDWPDGLLDIYDAAIAQRSILSGVLIADWVAQKVRGIARTEKSARENDLATLRKRQRAARGADRAVQSYRASQLMIEQLNEERKKGDTQFDVFLDQYCWLNQKDCPKQKLAMDAALLILERQKATARNDRYAGEFSGGREAMRNCASDLFLGTGDNVDLAVVDCLMARNEPFAKNVSVRLGALRLIDDARIAAYEAARSPASEQPPSLLKIHALESGVDESAMTSAAERMGTTVALSYDGDLCKLWDGGLMLRLMNGKCPVSFLSGPQESLSREIEQIYWKAKGKSGPPTRSCAPAACWKFEGFWVSTADGAWHQREASKLKSSSLKIGFRGDPENIERGPYGAPPASAIAAGLPTATPEAAFLLEGRARLQKLKWLFDPQYRHSTLGKDSSLARVLFVDPSVSICLVFPTWIEWCTR